MTRPSRPFSKRSNGNPISWAPIFSLEWLTSVPTNMRNLWNLSKRPDMPELHYALGNVYWKRRDLDKAEEQFRKELQIDPENYLATWKLGNIYLSKRQYDQAFPYLDKAVQQKPDLAQAHRDLGRALIQTGNFERAVVQLKEVAQLTPEESTSHYLMAQAYRKLGKKAEEKAELDLFEKLRHAEREREKGPGILTSGTQDETNEGHSEESLLEP